MNLIEYINGLKDKTISLVGIGVSNTPLIKLLLDSGCNVTARDKSATPHGDLAAMGAKLILGDRYLENLDEDIIFRTPGLHPDTPELKAARERGAIITSEMEAFFEVCPCKTIAVTGSDGKTTTTSIISEILKRGGYTVHLGGNIGTPLLCDADKIQKNDIAVLELSSFQLMTMIASPDIAVITNIAPNHLDVHKDMQEYIDAKKNIFLYQHPGSKLILNKDNDITASFANQSSGETILFSRWEQLASGYYCEDGSIFAGDEWIMDAADIFIPGAHNIENYMAAFAATEGFVSREVQRETAKTFKGVEHRIEHVRQLRGVDYYNDSIASSPSRTIAGLNSFDQKVILIAGGKDKGVPFDELGTVINERVKRLVLTGLTKDKIADAVRNAENYSNLEISIIDDFKDAVIAASNSAEEGDIVILSPACTSFDRFKNFAERGKVFKEIVNSLE